MRADDIWKLFVETGDIIYYLLYREIVSEETAAKA